MTEQIIPNDGGFYALGVITAQKDKSCKRFLLALKKNGTTEQFLGCTWEELKVHIESKFLPGMNWENRNQWHIDHIIPLASAKTPKEIEDLCKWHNLQPLWREDNLKKGAKLITAHIDLG